MKHLFIIYFLIIVIALPISTFSSDVSVFEDADEIEKIASSVIYIEADDDYDDSEKITGSGFIAFNEKTIITNYHVIQDAIRIVAFDNQNNFLKGIKVIAVDKERDIAILSFKENTSMIPLYLSYPSEYKRGQKVAAIGYPKGLFNTFSTGIISAVAKLRDKTVIQFTAPISHGSSGGALFNSRGEVIGITSSTIEDGQNINFAIDIVHAIELYRKYDPLFVPNKQKPTMKQATIVMPTQTITKDKLSTPVIVSANLNDSTLELTWEKVPGASKYLIYRSSLKNGPYLVIGTTSDLKFEDSPKYLSHFYKVIAFDEDYNSSEFSKPMEVIVQPPVQTPQPSSIKFSSDEEISKYKTLDIGMNDPAVGRLKERMYELGYFSNNTVNNNYTKNTAEYVKQFQKINGLEITGIATPEMQALFFSENAISKPKSITSSNTSKNLPIKLSDGVYFGFGPRIDQSIINTTKDKTVTEFTLVYHCYDKNNISLQFLDSEKDELYQKFKKEVQPGQSLYTGDVLLNVSPFRIDKVKVGIYSLRMSDGTEIVVEKQEVKYKTWDFNLY